jgi:hypothetical protein
MPISYARDDARRRIIAVSSGTVTMHDVLAIIDRQAADGVWDHGVLYDARYSDGLPQVSEMQQTMDHILQVGAGRPRGPVAIVTFDDRLFRLARVYSLGGKFEPVSTDVSVFRDVETAEEWLDLKLGFREQP